MTRGQGANVAAILVGLREAVVKALDAASEAGLLGLEPFTCDQDWDPEEKLEEVASLQVGVGMAALRMRRASRVQWEHDYDVDVFLAQRTDRSRADIDEKLKLPELLAKIFDTVELDYAADFLEAKVEPFLDLDHLRQHSLVSSLVVLTFRLWTPGA